MLTYDLSVVVGTYNRLSDLKKCISSIFDNANIKIKVYVTDAGSTDGTADYLKNIESDAIDITLHSQKLGQAKAYNEIFNKVTSPYVCWLSDDNIVVNNGLENAVRILNTNNNIGMVGLKVKDISGPFTCEPYIGGLSEAGILNVNQGVLSTELLLELGGFSEEFMDYGIDPDLTARVLFSGKDIAYTKVVSILHNRDWGESDALGKQFEKQAEYKRMYKEKYANCITGSKTYCIQRMLAAPLMRFINLAAQMLGYKMNLNIARDIYNAIAGKHISFFDAIYHKNHNYHLLQRATKIDSGVFR
jgi:GT2 family glycosyltransferase